MARWGNQKVETMDPINDSQSPMRHGLFERPGIFLAACGVFPLFAIGAMLQQWWLIKGEVHGTAAALALGLWAVPAALSALGWACWGWMRAAGRRRTNAWVMSGFAVAGVACLWGMFPAMERVMKGLPDAEPAPMGIFSVFLGLLTMVYAGVGRWMDAGARKGKRWWLVTLEIGLGGVLALVVLLAFPFRHPWRLGGAWLAATMAALGVGVYVFGTLAALFGLLRIPYWLGRKRREGPHREAWRIGEALLFGLALPLFGLALNLKIPFPADFANPWTWGIAVAAGLVLLTPLGGGAAGLAAWAARWAVGVYVLYFFLLFLPFLMKELNRRSMFLGAAIAGSSLFVYSFILRFFIRIFPRYARYIGGVFDTAGTSGVYLLFGVVELLMIIVCLVFLKPDDPNNTDVYRLLFVILYSFTLILMQRRIVLARRLGYYFELFLILLIPEFVNKWKKNERLFLKVGFYFFGWAYFIYSMTASNARGCVPYFFFWQE